ncbi:hypothetical protein A2G95_27500 [Klebsiella quasipneumoniae subsp. similipneumoniae]|nr:hypothetical protein A2G95_27500 [Klebsiella quasipneumoniae subsp. similipneumoniae]
MMLAVKWIFWRLLLIYVIWNYLDKTLYSLKMHIKAITLKKSHKALLIKMATLTFVKLRMFIKMYQKMCNMLKS